VTAAAGGTTDVVDATDGSSAKIAANLVAIGIILLVCIAAVAMHVSSYRQLSPLDEQAHLDYVNRIVSGDLPAIGDKLTRETRLQVACRGLETPVGFSGRTNCKVYRTDAMLPAHGNSYEAGQPPLYYAVTAAVSRIVPGDDVDSMRRTGGLWLGIGAIALYLTLRRFAVKQLYAAVLSLALALSPPLLLAASTVSDDIAVWTFGAIALWAVVGLMQLPSLRYPHLLIGGLIGVVGGLVKPSALLIVGTLGFAVILQQWWVGRRNWGLMLGASLVAGAVVSTGVWGLVATSMQHEPLDHIQPWSRYRVSSLSFDDLFKEPLFHLVSTLRAFIPSEWRDDWILKSLIQIAVYVQIGLLLLPLLTRWPSYIGRAIGVAYITAVFIAGPYYVVLYYVATHILYGAATRFGFGLIPLLAVVLVVWVQYRWQRWTLAVILALPALWYALLVSGAVTAATR